MGDRRDYSLEAKPIGSGGFAEVFEAVRRSDHARFAFKRLRNESDEESRARLAREIDVLSKLSHLNIMPLIDSNVAQGWYVMPLATNFLSKEQLPIPTDKLLDVTIAIVQALSASDGHIHRDITPNNVLFLGSEPRPRWVLSDWGLVRRPPGETTVRRTSAAVGTDGFIAPECWADGHVATIKSDIFSLGVLISWARTGQWPSPAQHAIPLDEWLPVVTALTSKDPAKRPKDLDAVLTGC